MQLTKIAIAPLLAGIGAVMAISAAPLAVADYPNCQALRHGQNSGIRGSQDSGVRISCTGMPGATPVGAPATN